MLHCTTRWLQPRMHQPAQQQLNYQQEASQQLPACKETMQWSGETVEWSECVACLDTAQLDPLVVIEPQCTSMKSPGMVRYVSFKSNPTSLHSSKTTLVSVQPRTIAAVLQEEVVAVTSHLSPLNICEMSCRGAFGERLRYQQTNKLERITALLDEQGGLNSQGFVNYGIFLYFGSL